MRRMMMASGVALAFGAGAALAQQPAAGEETARGADAPTAEQAAGQAAGVTMYDRLMVIEDKDSVESMLASEWIGQRVYSTAVEWEGEDPETPAGPEDGAPLASVGKGKAAPEPEPERVSPPMQAMEGGPSLASIGEVSDLILDEQGRIAAVVVGVGGFLGMGETWVSAPFDRFTVAYDGETSWLETAISRDELEQVVDLAERRAEMEEKGFMATGPAVEGEPVERRAEEAGQAVEETAAEAGRAVEETAQEAGQILGEAAEDVERAAETGAAEFTAGSQPAEGEVEVEEK